MDTKAIENRNELGFAVFCIETVAATLGMNATLVFDALTKESDLLYSYIVPLYPVLHTQGKEYIANDIIGVMRERGVIA